MMSSFQTAEGCVFRLVHYGPSGGNLSARAIGPLQEKAMAKTFAGLVLAAGLALAPAIAQAGCAGHATTVSTAPQTPVQTAEAPAPTQSK
jgi:hypothetical protein